MNVTQNLKRVNITSPQLVNGASVATTAVDTAGFDEAMVIFSLGVTDAALTTLKVQESDDSGMSGAVDITGLVFGTSTDPDTNATSALPTATDDNKTFSCFIDLRGRQRYIDLVAVVAAGTTGANVSASCLVAKASLGPTSATTRGLASNLIA